MAEYKKVWDDFAEHVPYVWLYHTKWVIAYQDTYYGTWQLHHAERQEGRDGELGQPLPSPAPTRADAPPRNHRDARGVPHAGEASR
ncbi:MAG: hypothetical protein R2726_10695 [Acidimicrobiales bacterium]